MTDPKIGVKERSYRQILCTVQLAGSTVSLIHIQMTSSSSFEVTVLG